MATIGFYADNFGIVNLNGSGLGFYGEGFGQSVDVGDYQDATFITNSNGTVEGEQVNNIKWTHQSSGEINGVGTSIALTSIPNYLATLNIRFTHTTAVKVQNVELRIFDRVSIDNPASGVTCKVAELIHTSTVQGATGSGDSTWYTPAGSSVVVPLAQSPGESGAYAAGGAVSTRDDDRHDWYVAISASPNSIGSKLFAAYVELEYL